LARRRPPPGKAGPAPKSLGCEDKGKAMNKIMIVDDDPELRTTIAEIIEQEGFEVQTAETADQALKLLEKSFFDLVLLDMVMPGTDGVTAIVLIKKLSPRTRIVMMTAYASIENAVQAMQQGADDYLSKPFKIEALLTTVRKNLQEARFAECAENVDSDGVFQGLANLLRRRIIILLQQQGNLRFMDLVRALGVEDHTKVNFHLKVLREAGFIEQNEGKTYTLTTAGNKAAACLAYISKSLQTTD
jgi:DNA-binding response OmpR family regulator